MFNVELLLNYKKIHFILYSCYTVLKMKIRKHSETGDKR